MPPTATNTVLSIGEMQPSGSEAVRIAAAMLVLAFLSVFFRLLARRRSHSHFGLGELLIVAALCLFGAYVGVFIRGLQTSDGTLYEFQLAPQAFGNFFKYIYVNEILFTVTISLVKFSILFFYLSIFTTPKFHKLACLAMSLVGAWFLIFLFMVIFQCSPIHGFWDIQLVAKGEASCISFGKFLTAYEVTNVLVDVFILCLPTYMIKTLQLPTSRKVGLVGVFLLGGFVCIICIVRICYLADTSNADQSHSLPPRLNWSMAEIAVAIVCACLPTYGPLLRDANKIPTTLRGWFGSRIQITDTSSTAKNSFKENNKLTLKQHSNMWNLPQDDFEYLTRGDSYQLR